MSCCKFGVMVLNASAVTIRNSSHQMNSPTKQCKTTASFQMFIWFTAALYFFALSFNMNDVMGNPYINLAATGTTVWGRGQLGF